MFGNKRLYKLVVRRYLVKQWKTFLGIAIISFASLLGLNVFMICNGKKLDKLGRPGGGGALLNGFLYAHQPTHGDVITKLMLILNFVTFQVFAKDLLFHLMLERITL